MSILTKIFVVLVTVLSVALVAMVVPFAMNVETFKQKYYDAAAEVHVAKAQVQELKAAKTRAENELNQQKQAEATAIANLKNQLARMQTDMNLALAQKVAAENQAADIRAELSTLTSSLEQATDIHGLLQAEIRRRREESLKLQQENIALNNTLRDQKTMLESLGEINRFNKEEIVGLEEQNRDLRERLQAAAVDTGDEAEKPVFKSPVQLRGTVTEVRHVGDNTFVAINLGSNDGVREGMQFVIHDDNTFVGNAVVHTVELNEAAARVTLVPENQQIQANQQVWSGDM